jgi:hypothetical protein
LPDLPANPESLLPEIIRDGKFAFFKVTLNKCYFSLRDGIRKTKNVKINREL